uniref:Uncharacterized protein n=1 Tax=Timema shepardi TaxID=629360 RepID=A0A7R9BCG8_TIMSH|nr:unnamed protein product [Timema shepardi]
MISHRKFIPTFKASTPTAHFLVKGVIFHKKITQVMVDVTQIRKRAITHHSLRLEVVVVAVVVTVILLHGSLTVQAHQMRCITTIQENTAVHHHKNIHRL